MAYFSTNAICFKKKKKRIWAWIKLIINTFNVNSQDPLKNGNRPLPAGEASGAGGLHNFPFCFSSSKTQFAPLSQGKHSPAALAGCSPGGGHPGYRPPPPPPSKLSQGFVPTKRRHLPKHPAENMGVWWSTAAFQSHLRKSSPKASTWLWSTERKKCWKGGVGDSVVRHEAAVWAHLLWPGSTGYQREAPLF